jgi:2-aminoadipate transaminase
MPRIKPGGGMRITQRRRGWEDLFATRTRGDVGEGLGSILALSTATDLISFSGGFPDPATFPGPVLAEILRRLIAAGDASAMQYAPTPGSPASRLHR